MTLHLIRHTGWVICKTFTQEFLFPGHHQYPEGSSCMETELECSAINLKSVPLVSSNITLLYVEFPLFSSIKLFYRGLNTLGIVLYYKV